MMGKKKKSIQDRVNNLFKYFESKGIIKRTPAFLYQYRQVYPELSILEENYQSIRHECLSLMKYKDRITDLEALGGTKTKGGIHAVKWKSFMLKSGKFLPGNCDKCPETTRLLKQIPGVKQAFFSILDPRQHIQTHKGYYYGFLRYHLGLVIPNNNEDNNCWIRINDDYDDNKKYDKSSIVRGEKYYWKNGEGIMFNDNYLHEAMNDSDEVRVVLFMDIERKMPFPLNLLNRILLTVAYASPQVKRVARKAEVSFDLDPAFK